MDIFLVLLQNLSLNLFTTKKVSLLLFRSHYIWFIFMVCHDASCLIFDNPLQTNEKQLHHYRKPYGNYCSLYWSVQINFSFIPWNAEFFIFVLSFGWNATTEVFVTVVIHGGIKFNQQWIKSAHQALYQTMFLVFAVSSLWSEQIVFRYYTMPSTGSIYLSMPNNCTCNEFLAALF